MTRIERQQRVVDTPSLQHLENVWLLNEQSVSHELLKLLARLAAESSDEEGRDHRQ